MDPLTPSHLRTQLARVQHWLFPTEPEHDPSWGRRLWLLAVYTVRRWLFTDRCSSLASSLTLQVLLSVVPIVGVILFFVGMLDPSFGTQFVEQVAYAIGPDTSRAKDLAQGLVELASSMELQKLGRWGLLVVIALAFASFSTLEKTVNEIWRVSRTRTLVTKFTMFYTLASLGPIIVFYSLAQPLLSQIGSMAITPVVTSSIGMILLNRYLPHQTVRWRAAVIGGLISASLFEFSKFTFGQYLNLVSIHTYEGIYGSLAILPVFVVWAYLSCLILLLGAETTFVVHHLSSIAREGYVQPNHRVQRRLLPSPGRTAARLLLAIADNYDRSSERPRPLPEPLPDRKERSSEPGPGLTVDDLNERFDIGLAPIVALTDRLEQAGLIVELGGDQGYVPGLPLDQIVLAEVLHLFDGGDLESARADALGDLFSQLDDQQSRKIGELDFRALIELERNKREGRPRERRRAQSPKRSTPTPGSSTPVS